MDWPTLRASYCYPPARLVRVGADAYSAIRWPQAGLNAIASHPPEVQWRRGTEIRRLYSSFALDEYHRGLLTNPSDDSDRLLGLLSVCYWGYAAGARGPFTLPRAVARTMWLIEGKASNLSAKVPANLDAVLKSVEIVVKLAAKGDIAGALLSALEIKYFGMSFASKLLTFCQPDQAAVYDKVVAQALRLSTDPQLRGFYVDPRSGGIKRQKVQADFYARWCKYCFDQANVLNGRNITWTDWDGSSHAWRAVDIERAFFASAAI